MMTSTGNFTRHSVSKGILSQDDFLIILSVIYYFCLPLSVVSGLVGNFLNIVIFSKMGLRDSVTISFWALSISDFVFLLISLVVVICNIFGLVHLGQVLPVSVFSLSAYVFWYSGTFLDISMGITVFIAIARCCCVVLALKFKRAFTVKRTCLILFCLVCCVLAVRVPRLTATGLSWQINPVTNRTRLLLWFSGEFEELNDITEVMTRTVYPNVVFLTVLVCSIILTNALCQASKKRKEMTCRGVKHTDPKEIHEQSGLKPIQQIPKLMSRDSFSKRNTSARTESTVVLSTKEIQVVKAVVMVSLFLLLSVLFMSASTLCTFVVPGFYPGQQHGYSQFVLSAFEFLSNYINASVNIFIYLKFNSKFKKLFIQVVT